MLSTAQLLLNLDFFEAKFQPGSPNLRDSLLPSKAAILDVCGWVEEAMDLLVLDSAGRAGLSPQRIKSIRENYVKPTFGFQYEKHFERMLTAVVGFKVLEEIEAAMPAVVLSPFRSTLSTLIPLRNHYAHTHFDEIHPYPASMTSIPAPTSMRQHAVVANAGLVEFEIALMARGF